jgi:rhamnose transport system permease protein
MNGIRTLIRPEQIREFSLLFIILAALVLFGTAIDNFITPRTFNRISTSVAIIIVIAAGQTLVILTRNIDLSVGSTVGLAAYVVGIQIGATPGTDWTPPMVIGLCVALGALIGLINGALVTFGRVPSIIVTLGMLAIVRGVLVEYSQARTVTASTLPGWLSTLPSQNAFTIGEFDIRLMVVIALAVVVVFQLLLRFTRYGRRLYAVGSNPEGAHMAGLPARRVVLLAFVLCGALAGLAGFMFLARFGTISVVAGQGLELQAIAACVVGGVSTLGGTGSMFGMLLGAVLIGTLEQSLLRLDVSEFWKDALLGAFILIAVVSDALILNRLKRWWARGTSTLRPLDASPQPHTGAQP